MNEQEKQVIRALYGEAEIPADPDARRAYDTLEPVVRALNARPAVRPEPMVLDALFDKLDRMEANSRRATDRQARLGAIRRVARVAVPLLVLIVVGVGLFFRNPAIEAPSETAYRAPLEAPAPTSEPEVPKSVLKPEDAAPQIAAIPSPKVTEPQRKPVRKAPSRASAATPEPVVAASATIEAPPEAPARRYTPVAWNEDRNSVREAYGRVEWIRARSENSDGWDEPAIPVRQSVEDVHGQGLIPASNPRP